MPLMVEIPDDVARELSDDAVERLQQARELIALELYREGRVSLRTMGRLAGVGGEYWDADAFRDRHEMPVSGFRSGEADDLSAFSGMKILEIPYADSLPDAARMSVHEFENELKMALATKLFELGRLPSGQAAELAGLGRVEFLKKLSLYNVKAIDWDAEEFAREIENA